MIWNVLAIALAASLFAAAPAEAAPVVAAWAAITAGISAITSTAVGAFLFRVAASVVLSALAAAIRGKPDAPERPGIRTEATTTGGVNSETFILGRYATSGNLVAPPYSHENSGENPNLFLTYVVDVSDLPGVQFSRLIVGGEYIDDLQLNTVTGGEHQYEGNFNVNDWGTYPYLWMTWHDGSQTAADAYMMAHYASDPERPWAADMVGQGIAYAVITFYFAPDVYSGQPGVRFEVEGIPLYDPRKDSTVGGTGSHRWANKATWEFSENPLVMVYNILRGIEMPGGRIWGGKVAASDLPLANWFAAMNVCDEDVTLKAGGTEKRYRAGYEVKTADDEPASVITELLKACSAEIVEFGGVYKVRVGGPGVPVYYFTDDDIVSDNPQSLVPFPGLESVYNGIHASHPDPKAMWETRDAPPRYNATWEGDDGDRQLIAHVDLPAVSSRPQVQRLMKAWIADERRFRRHSLTLPPDAAVLEPLDSVGWTSARNQYSAEVFEIGELSDDPRSMLQTVAMRARKTGDFDWVPGDEIDVDDPSTIMVKPPVRSVPGWAVSAVSVKNAAGTGKRPAIKIEWDGTKVGDATALEFEVRPYGQTDLVSQGAKTDVAKGQGLVTSGILPGAALEVRGRLVTTRRRAWTAWTYVVTLNIKPGEDDLDETLTTSTVPTGLTVTSDLVKDGVAKIIITWIAGANAVSHEIGIKRTGGNEVIKKAGGTRYEFETQPGAEFDIRVRAVSGTGSVSAWTATETIVAALDAIPPADPTGLAAQAGYGVMWLSWNANTEADLSHYEVIQKTNSTTPSAGATPKFSAAGTAATISGLANSTRYWYWVRAVDTSGNKSGWSSPSDATTAGTIAADVTNASLIGLVDATSFAANMAGVEIKATLPASGNFEGRIVFLTSDEKLYRHDGTAWTKAVDGADLVADSVTTGAIAAGAVKAEQIDAYAATFEKLAIGDFTNFCGGSTGNWNRHPWDLATGASLTGGVPHSPGYSLGLESTHVGSSTLKTLIECKEGDQFYLTYWVRPNFDVVGMTSLGSRIRVSFYDEADSYVIATNIPWDDAALSTWTQKEAKIVTPAGAVTAIVRIQSDHTAGIVRLDDIAMRRIVDGVFIADGAITAGKMSSGEVITTTAQIKDGIITNAKISDLSAGKINAGTALAGSITVSGTALSTIETRADDPAARINGKSTEILPGKIVISGGTTLADWRKSGDVTKIDGGSISANTVTANEMKTGTITAASGIIANAAVETLKIAGNAVTIPVYAQDNSYKTFTSSSTWIDCVSLTIDRDGYATALQFTSQLDGYGSSGMEFRILRDGTDIQSGFSVWCHNLGEQQCIAFSYLDGNTGTGSTTYKVQGKLVSSSANNGRAFKSYLSAHQFKR